MADKIVLPAAMGEAIAQLIEQISGHEDFEFVLTVWPQPAEQGKELRQPSFVSSLPIIDARAVLIAIGALMRDHEPTITSQHVEGNLQ